MSKEIDSLYISLGLDPGGVRAGMAQAEGLIQRGVNSLRTLIAPLAGALSFGALFGEWVSAGRELDALSRTTGESVQTLDAWGMAAERAGGSASAMRGTLESLNRQLAEASMTGRAKVLPFLNMMGVRALDAGGKARKASDVMLDVAARLERMSPNQARFAMNMSGMDEGTIRLLKTGSANVRELVGNMRKLAYSQEDAERATQFKNSITDLGRACMGASSILFRLLTPAISWFSRQLQDFFLVVRENEGFVKVFFIALSTLITARAIPAIVALGRAWLANPMGLAIAGIAAAVTLLALVIEDLWVYMQGGKTAFGEFWAIFGTGKEITQALSSAWKELKAVGAAFFNALLSLSRKFFEYFGPALKNIKQWFAATFRAIKALFTGDFEGLGDALVDMFVASVGVLGNMFNGLANLIYDLFVAAFTRLIPWIVSKVKELPGKLAELAESLFKVFSRIASRIGGAIRDGLVNAIRDALDFLPDSVKKVLGLGGTFGKSETGETFMDRVQNSVDLGGYEPDADGAIPVYSAADVLPGGGAAPARAETNIRNHTALNINNMTVTTQATDAQGVARGMGGALNTELTRGIAYAAQTGTVQK